MTAQKYSAVCFIMNHGKGADLTAALHRLGVRGATVVPARGTVTGTWASFFCLDEVRRDMVFFVDTYEEAQEILRKGAEQFKLNQRNHGIAFSVPVVGIYGVHDLANREVVSREVADAMWQIIYTVVNKGEAKGVIDAATAAGARGGTIANGRGSASHTGAMLFDFPIEPEKEVVFILATSEKTQAIVDNIHREMRIDEPGRGIMFVMNVEKAYGLLE